MDRERDCEDSGRFLFCSSQAMVASPAPNKSIVPSREQLRGGDMLSLLSRLSRL